MRREAPLEFVRLALPFRHGHLPAFDDGRFVKNRARFGLVSYKHDLPF
jgi:hypothetical protein